MKILFWIVVLPLVILATAFAVNNRADVTLNLTPFPYTLMLPVYLAVLLSVLAGFLIGGFVSWLSHGKLRRLLRQRNRHIGDLERELLELRDECDERDERDEEASMLPSEKRADFKEQQTQNGAQPSRAENP